RPRPPSPSRRRPPSEASGARRRPPPTGNCLPSTAASLMVRSKNQHEPCFRGMNLPEPLDAVDAKILDLIQHDAGLSVAEIADRVGLSSSPCWRRIKRLEDAGVIQRRVTILDREKLGLGFEVYWPVKLRLPTKDHLDHFEA